MSNHSEYICSSCKQQSDKDLLTAVKVSFMEVGEGGRTVKSRIVAWLCPTCLVKDPLWGPIWTKPKYSTPGHTPSDSMVALKEKLDAR